MLKRRGPLWLFLAAIPVLARLLLLLRIARPGVPGIQPAGHSQGVLSKQGTFMKDRIIHPYRNWLRRPRGALLVKPPTATPLRPAADRHHRPRDDELIADLHWLWLLLGALVLTFVIGSLAGDTALF